MPKKEIAVGRLPPDILINIDLIPNRESFECFLIDI